MSIPAGMRWRTALRLSALLGLSLASMVCSGGTDERSCAVSSVTVQPGQVTLTVGASTTVTAQVTSSNCDNAPAVTWSTSDATRVTIQPNGNQAQITGIAQTSARADLALLGAPVTVTATSLGETGTTLVTVLPPPAIDLSTSTLTFDATVGGANPASQAVTISNGGGGTLTGLSVGTITYGAGATGWLQAPGLSSTTANPSAILTVQPVTGALTAGTYTATIPVESGVAANSPQNISVSFTVTATPPAIALNPTSLTFNATPGGANPASQAVNITNSGGGTLTGLAVGTITYGAGATGWLQAPSLSSTTANPSAILTVQPVTGALTAGSYTATVPVTAAAAANSPQSIAVTFTVSAAPQDPCLFANAAPIAAGQTVNDSLSAAGCLLPSGHYADLYLLTLAAPANVVIDLTASWDPFLSLFDFTTGTLIEEDDDDGPGLNAHISRTLPAGQYILRARSFDTGVTGAYSLAVQTFAAGQPASIAINAGNAQVALPGTNAPIAPSVVVRDISGFGVPGATVTFETVSGIGSVTGASTTTDANGIATVGSWTLAAGPNVLSATVSGTGITGNPAIFSATGSDSPAGFDVHLRFLTMPTPSQFQVFATAVTRWQAIITNDLADLAGVSIPANACADDSPAINETIDDLIIQVRLGPIDGPGAILGAAGPCFIRSVGSLPVLGVMQFDEADLAMLETAGSLGPVILHEMGHVIGIGTLWPLFGLLVNPSLPSSPGVDTHNPGVNGIAGFNAIGGATYTGGLKVPVENAQGGQGTRDAHWRESVLVNELMTGFLNAGANPLSLLTVQSLQDMGYAVDVLAADPFFLTLTIRAEGAEPPRLRMLNDVRPGPIYRVDTMGRITDAAGRPVFVAPKKQ